MNRGEIWWVEIPGSGRRPACILTRQPAIPLLTSLTVAPATRTVRGAPSELLLDEQDGLPAPCALNFDNIATVPKALFATRITRLSGRRLAEVCGALRRATGC